MIIMIIVLSQYLFIQLLYISSEIIYINLVLTIDCIFTISIYRNIFIFIRE